MNVFAFHLFHAGTFFCPAIWMASKILTMRLEDFKGDSENNGEIILFGQHSASLGRIAKIVESQGRWIFVRDSQEKMSLVIKQRLH